jgi:uncharacterized protein
MVVSGKDWPGYAKGTVPECDFEWKFIEATPPDIPNRDPECVYIPLGYEKKLLPRGWQKTPENRPLDVDIIFEKDVKIVLRDGVTVLPFWIGLMVDLYGYLSSC